MDPVPSSPAPQASIPPVVQPPQSKSKVWLWIVGGVLLLGVGIVAGVFLGKQFYSQNTAQISSYDQCVAAKGSRTQESYPATCVTASGERFIQPVSTPTTTPTETTDPTATWKTYTDNKIGFSFKYPTEWTYKLGETNSTTGHVIFDTNLASGNKNTNYIFEITSETEANLNQWSKYPTTTTLGPQMINGMSFEKYVVADMYYSLNYILKQNDKIIRFLVYPYDSNQYPAELKINIDQILSTFKFLYQATISNSCTTDADCGVNFCDCKADLNSKIKSEDKICTRYCPGTPKCINSTCQLVN